MEFVRGFLRKIKLRGTPKMDDTIVQPKFETETDYYEWFFTQNQDWNGPLPNYDESIRWEGIKSLSEKLVDGKSDTFTILDLGCGRGWLTHLLSQYGSVIGVEPVMPVASYAKTLFPDMTFKVGNAHSLVNEGYRTHFDLIVSSEVIEHVPDIEKTNFLMQIGSLLKENGHFILTTPRKEALREYLKHIQPSQPIEDWLTEGEIKSLLVNNGFSIIENKRIRKKLSVGVELDIYQLWLAKRSQGKTLQ